MKPARVFVSVARTRATSPSWSRMPRPYPPVLSQSVHTVTGTRSSAIASAAFCASIPAEKLMGRSIPRTSRNRPTSVIASTWSGGPDRYDRCTEAGKKPRRFSTTSVFVSFTPNERPSAAALSRSRPIIAKACSGVGSFAKASAGTTMSVYPSASWRSASASRSPRSVGLSFTTTARPCAVIRCSAIASISSGGQPWNVLSVTVSARTSSMPASARGRRSAGSSARSLSTIGRVALRARR